MPNLFVWIILAGVIWVAFWMLMGELWDFIHPSYFHNYGRMDFSYNKKMCMRCGKEFNRYPFWWALKRNRVFYSRLVGSRNNYTYSEKPKTVHLCS